MLEVVVKDIDVSRVVDEDEDDEEGGSFLGKGERLGLRIVSISSYWPNILLTIQYRLLHIVTIRYQKTHITIISRDPYIGQYHIVYIVVNTVYNFDETGFLMGQISTTTVVTSAERRGKAKSIQPGNRELVIVIQGVNSQGWAIPPFIIFAGKNHLSSWYENSSLPKDWIICVTENGWTTNEKGLEWIQHFDKYTKSRSTGGYRLLILDGHESHHSVDFELYCKEENIITLCMPPHSSHILQPLDVGCFSPLKTAYGNQIGELMKLHRTHINKEDFLPAFYAAFLAAMIESNVRGGFRGAGLVPFDPEHVISQLDLKLKTPTPPRSQPGTAQPWVSKTPNNPAEASSQSIFLRTNLQASE